MNESQQFLNPKCKRQQQQKRILLVKNDKNLEISVSWIIETDIQEILGNSQIF